MNRKFDVSSFIERNCARVIILQFEIFTIPSFRNLRFQNVGVFDCCRILEFSDF